MHLKRLEQISLFKDTLQWRVLDVIPGHGGRVKAHRAGKLAHQMVLEILSALILFTSVDKHLVLKQEENNKNSAFTGDEKISLSIFKHIDFQNL